MPADPEKLTADHPPQESSLKRHHETILLVLLMAYVILLLIGTIGNLFDIDAITSFWLYK